ncbi:MAG TPA: acyltransferase [Candidatus Saccharimonadales bacterium]|nr:acyltransferase [Candidatus Saccharimonadales bacterium]
MKDRLPALDGLRGFAALAVMLSHIGYHPASLISVPFVIAAYNTLQVGPNSVQILFVLSGFLMAFLYPQTKNPRSFIQKRYARIFPIYATIVLFLWAISIEQVTTIWWLQIILLLALAMLIFILWNLIKKIPKIGKIVFFSFISLQIVMFLIVALILPHFVQSDVIQLPTNIKNMVILLSNITLTTPFSKDIPRLSLVFWSLAPEVYFYLLYPFIVVPLIKIGKQYGMLVSVLIIIGVTKILFDLDKEFVAVGGLQSINIARSSGFVAGVTIGTIYQTKGKIWQTLEPLLKNKLFSLVVLLLFITIQWGDWAIRDGQSIFINNIYYCISSWVFSLTILVAIIPRTYVFKIFSSKMFVFLGIISYSLYLIHPQTITWAQTLKEYFRFVVPSDKFLELIFLIIAIVLSIAVASILFRTIEYLYFSTKKKKAVLMTTLAKDGEGEPVTKESSVLRHPGFKLGFGILAFFILYVAAYTPSQLVSRNAFTGVSLSGEQSLLTKRIRIPFTSYNENLSAVSLYLRYAKNAMYTQTNRKNPATLQFSLLDTKNKKLFSSARNAYIVEGSPRFGFGFPAISDSKGKSYIAELSLSNGRPDDQIFIDTTPSSFVSINTIPKNILLHSPWIVFLNRLLFVLTNPEFIFAVIFIFFTVYLDWRLSLKKHTE